MTRAITFMSFGFGFPQVPAAALVFDVRPLLPDPYEDPALREFTGRDQAVREHVLRQPNTTGVLDSMDATVRRWLRLWPRTASTAFVVGVGCLGGRSRSPVLVEELAARFTAPAFTISVVHRDIDRPLRAGHT